MAGTRSLGTLTLDLVAKVGGFVEGMNKAARIADTRLKHIERSFHSVGRAVKVAFATIATAAVFKDVIGNTIELQKQQAQLSTILKSTGDAAGYTKKQLNDMAVSLSKTTNFSKEEITSAQVRLLSYTDIVGEQFPKAMQEALDQAQRLGIGVEQSAETIGKALQKPSVGIAALTKQGFKFTDQQKKMMKALEDVGRLAESQAIVMEALDESYQGAAKAARDTMGGALVQLKNSFQDLLTLDESGGSVANLRDAIEGLNNELNDPAVKDGMQSLITGMINLASATAKVVTLIPNVTKFVAEELARATGHFAIDDTTGIDAKIGDIKDRLNDLNEAAKVPWWKRIVDNDKAVLGIDKQRSALVKQLATLEKLQKVGKTLSSDHMLGQVNGAASDFISSILEQKGAPKPLIIPLTAAQMAAARAAADALTSAYTNLYAEVNKLQAEGDPTSKIMQEYATRISHLAELGGAVIKAGGDVTTTQKAVADGVEELKKQMAFDLDAPARAVKQYTDALDEQLRAQQENIDVRVKSIGMGDKEAANMAELARIEFDRASALRKLTQQHQMNPDSESDATFQKKLEATKKYWDDVLRSTQDGQSAVDKATANWQNGVTTAVQNFMDDQANMYEQGKRFTTELLGGVGDSFADIVSGAKSAKDAIGGLLDSLYRDALKFVANKAIQALLQSIGGGSSGGGVLASLFGPGTIGDGLAIGGPAGRGSIHEVTEHGPEVLSAGGRNYLMMGNNSGNVVPLHQTPMQNGTGSQINVYVQPTSTQRSADQTALAVARKQREVSARNG